MGKAIYRANWPIRIASILLCLVLITTYMMTGLYARYTVSGESSDSARVAAFDVEVVENIAASDLEYDLGDDPLAVYEVRLANNSEVAVSYNVVLSLEEALPKGVKPEINSKTGVMSADERVYTFNEVGTLDVGGSSVEQLELKADGNSVVNNFVGETDIDWTSSRNIKVSVEFIQID